MIEKIEKMFEPLYGSIISQNINGKEYYIEVNPRLVDKIADALVLIGNDAISYLTRIHLLSLALYLEINKDKTIVPIDNDPISFTSTKDPVEIFKSNNCIVFGLYDPVSQTIKEVYLQKDGKKAKFKYNLLFNDKYIYMFPKVALAFGEELVIKVLPKSYGKSNIKIIGFTVEEE